MVLQDVKTFLEGLNWIAVLFTIIGSFGFLFSIIMRIVKYYNRKKWFNKIRKHSEKMCVISIGLGKNNPFEKAVEHFGEEYRDKIIPFYKCHAGDKDEDLTDDELYSAFKDVRSLVGELRRSIKDDIYIFYAGPLSGAFHLGNLFKNFAGEVQFMQYDFNKKQYGIMPYPK